MQSERQLQFAALLLSNKKLIFKILNSHIQDQGCHDDLFQEISLKAWECYDDFKGKSKFSVWLAQIAKFTVIDKLRRLQAHANRISKYNVFYEITTSLIDEPYSERSLPIIDSLSEVEKRTLQMRIEGLTFNEISQITGEPINRLLIRMYRIKERLSKSLKTCDI